MELFVPQFLLWRVRPMTSGLNEDGRRQRINAYLNMAASAAMLVASGTLIWAIWVSASSTKQGVPPTSAASRPSLSVPTEPISLIGAKTLGSPTAKVVVLEYSDFDCPFCARFHDEAFATFRKSYVDSGRALFAFRHLPLESRHPNALSEAKAAECAGSQNKFWEMSDALFRAPKAPGQDGLDAKARNVGLDLPRFDECLRSSEALTSVQSDIAQARTLSITSTPTFFIGTITDGRALKASRHEAGAIPAVALSRMVDQVLGTTGSR